MPINVAWDTEDQTIICYHFSEHWTWEEFFEARNQVLEQIDTVAHKVGVIMDTPPNIILPPNVLTHSLTSLRHMHPNTAIVVFIAGKSFLNMMVSMMAKMSRLSTNNIIVAANLDEARAIITKRLQEVSKV
ncbi:MAG: hypothetical protein ABI690_14745 [Chloroflexota bacterium]